MTLKGDLLTRYLLAPARRMQRVAFQALIDDLLHTAIETHNEKAVVKLLEYGASLSAYAFGGIDNDSQEVDAGEEEEEEGEEGDEGGEESGAADEAGARRTTGASKVEDAVNLWQGLIHACKSDPSTRHVYVFLKGIQSTFRARAALGSRGCGFVVATDSAQTIRSR